MSGPASDRTSVTTDASRGAVALMIRQIATAVLSVPVSIVLARLLAPADFGLYAIASFLIGVLQSNVVLGLGGWLIQTPDEPTERQVATIYTVQLCLCSLAFVVLVLAAPALMSWYGTTDPAAVNLIRILGISIFLTAFRIVPASLLERRLRYEYIANVEFVGGLAFQTTAITLAALGGHVWSLVAAVLAHAIVSVILMQRGARWRPRLGFEFSVIRKAMAFGAPWQLQRWVTLAKDNVVPTLIAARFGAEAVGYLALASATALRPLQIMPILDRVTFAAYARLREDVQKIATAVDRVLFFSAAIIIPPTTLVGVFAPQIMTLVYGDKWAPAALPAQWFCVAGIVASVNWPAGTTFFGLGKPWIALRITLVWTIVLWMLTLILIPRFGFVGFAIADASACCLVVLTLRELRRHVPLDVLGAVAKILGVSLAAGALAKFIASHVELTLATLAIVTGVLLVAVYVAIWALERFRTESVGRHIVGRVAAPLKSASTQPST
jgi:O-antigen/teichoic acid export membrane protein